jgi:hypothetical protein
MPFCKCNLPPLTVPHFYVHHILTLDVGLFNYLLPLPSAMSR